MRETFLERDWRMENRYGPFDIIRVSNYDPTFGCTFRTPTLDYLATTLGNDSVRVTPEWIEQALESMVRYEVGGRSDDRELILGNEILTVTDDIVYDLLAQYEAQIAFGQRTEAILENRDLSEPQDKILSLLGDSKIGNRNNLNEFTRAEIKRGLDTARASGGPLLFLLPAFPFKDQNPFRTDLPANVPDLGEVAMLIHLHCLAMAINQIFRHDVMWLIVSDGTCYEEVFGVEKGSGYRYLAALRDWRTRLNLTGSIHFIDLQEIVSRYDKESSSQGKQSFSVIKEEISDFLVRTIFEEPTSSVRTNLHELARGMLWNRGWTEAEDRYGLDVLWQIHTKSCNKEELPFHLHRVAEDLWSAAIETAINYAAFNLASKYTQLLSGFMPCAIRSTSHVKPGQVGIPRETGVSPWNGLAVYERRTTKARVRSLPMCQIAAPPLVRFRLHSGTFGFGFSTLEALECYL